jgi:hypothetical protein
LANPTYGPGVHALWSGKHDAERLTADIDPNSAQLVRNILALLAA